VTGELAWGERTTAQRFGVAATLTGAISVVTLVPTLLAVLAPLITEDLGLTRSGFGVLATGVFIGGGATSVWAGRIVDRLGGRSSLILLYLLTSITVVGVAVAPTYGWLLVAVTLSGLPGALSNPVTNQVISAVVPSGRRGLLIGFKQSGAQIAQVAGGLVLPVLALGAGWRGAALALASLPLFGVVATRLLVPARSGGATALPPGPLELRGPIVYLTAYALLMSLGAAAVLTYLPLFAYDALGFSLPAAGVIASSGAGAGFLGRVLWARAAELFEEAGYGDGGLEFTILTNQGNQNREASQVYLQEAMAAYGHTVNIETLAWGEFIAEIRAGTFDVAALSMPAAIPDPTLQDFMLMTDGPTNYGGWSNPEADELLMQAGRELDQEVRKELYGQVQALFAEDLPWVPNAWYPNNLVIHERFQGVDPSVIHALWNIHALSVVE